MWENLKKNSLINQKAQAILELATFGSAVLFCLALLVHFGLQMNYQQNIQMQAFRKGLRMAYYKQGPGSQASLVMIKDKPVIDPRDKLGFADRVTIGSSATISWDPNLNSLYVSDSSDEPDSRDLPRMYFEVDKSMGLSDSELNDSLDSIGINNKQLAQDKGIFTTANFAQKTLGAEDTLRVYVADTQNKHGGSYYHIDVKAKDVRVREDGEDPRQHYAVYLGADGLIRRLSSVDLTPNNAKIDQVNIIAVKGDRECIEQKCGKLAWIRYIDPKIGDINTEYVDIKPYDLDKKLEEQQGLLMGSSKKIDHGEGTKIIVKDKGREFSTETQSTAAQTITHKIKYQEEATSSGGTPLMIIKERKIPVGYQQPTRSYNWKVTHE